MSVSTPSPLRVAVLGAGPSGLFAADSLLKAHGDVSVDVLDRLPTPYGLVRYGVAPDHPRIKSVTKAFERTCRDERVRFLGNVAFGRDVDLADLREHYHAVLVAVGASSDRRLGITGEDLSGSMSATAFVNWYNGHPDAHELRPPLHARKVVVVGLGNVAVDVTRILAKSTEELAETDIADHALEALADSRVEEIVMLGRRGPAQGKFTTKELRELGELANADIDVDPAELELDPTSAAAAEADPGVTKNLEVLRGFAAKPRQGKPRLVRIRFQRSPLELLDDGAGHVGGVRLGHNRLEEGEHGAVGAVDDGGRETLEAQWVLRSVGYRGVPLPDLPFDERRGVLPNERGRVLDGGRPLPGVYAAGWIKRGPSGVIGTNKADAKETVEALVSDPLPRIAPEKAKPEAFTRLLRGRGVRPFTFDDWLALDAMETSEGSQRGRPRVKVTRLEEMLHAAEGVGG